MNPLNAVTPARPVPEFAPTHEIELHQPVGDIVARYPVTRKLLEQYRIDYCCGGKRSLDAACTARELDGQTVLASLRQAVFDAMGAPGEESEPDWRSESLSAITRYIVERYHVPLREELPRLERLAERVVQAHGVDRPETLDVRINLQSLRRELEEHMQKEERVLFPAIEATESAERAERGDSTTSAIACGFDGPIRTMEHEHAEAGSRLEELHRLTGGYQAPASACATFVALYDGLRWLEQEMHRHVHLENEILFPRALALEARHANATHVSTGAASNVRSCVLGVALALFAAVTSAQTAPFERDGRQYGLPEARVSEEPLSGSVVSGATLSLAPHLAKLPPVGSPARTWKVRFDIVAAEIEVAPGVRYRAWTFGGTVPGPVLHVREGDRVEFTLRNRSYEAVGATEPTTESGDLTPFLSQIADSPMATAKPSPYPMPHSMDFHAATVAMTDKWRTIQPGETLSFEWIANYPGVFLYHCGTPPVYQHMAMGQYGVVVVSPKEGFPTDAQIDREYVLVQSEFYLKPSPDNDGLHVLDYDAALAKLPTIVAFNGHKTWLAEHPLIAEPGERVRMYVHNVGPTDTSSFHVIGTIFDRVYYEGNPFNEMRGMQTVLLGASNGAVVEFVMPEHGGYAFVDHEFADVARGAVGRLISSKAVPATVAPAAAHTAVH